MGHHIDAEGRFQSDKYPDLAPDKIIVSFKDKRTWKALQVLAESYQEGDPGLSEDIRARIESMKETSNEN